MATCGRLQLFDQCTRLLPFMMGRRSFAAAANDTFRADDLVYDITKDRKPKPANMDECKFGKEFTDHMLSIEWNKDEGWNRPVIQPLQNISLHPATAVFHYATELFEGMKAYRTPENEISFFRPQMNMDRMLRSAHKACLPQFDGDEFLKCIAELVRVEQEWVPNSRNASLYMRPTFIGTEPTLGVDKSGSALLYCILCPVGSYFSTGTFEPVSLMADPRYIRASKGGFGAYKLGSNYGPTIRVQEEASKKGCEQVLWLYGDDHKITEVGTMNMFIHWYNENGEKELATMPLDEGIVLPGITRQSILDLTREWGDFKVTERTVTMSDLTKALSENRLIEMFGAGTACVVCPIKRILYIDQPLYIPTPVDSLALRLYKSLGAIHYGDVKHDWTYIAVEKTKPRLVI